MNSLRTVSLAIAAVAFALPSAALAGSATSNVDVSASVAADCTLTAEPLAFGNYDPIRINASTALDADGTIQYACTKGTSATIGLSLGANPSGSQNRMTDGTDFLSYTIYQDAAQTIPWGSSGTGLESLAASITDGPQSVTMYGQIPGGQDVGVGTYTDTVTATINF